MRTILSLIGLLFTAVPLSAQTIEIVGGQGDPVVENFRALLERGSYRVIDRDTVLGADSYISGDLVVVDARVAMEGRVTGSVAVVGGELFIRPSATVSGEILDLWDVYPSGLASIGPVSRVHRAIDVDVASRDGDFRVTFTRPPGPGLLRPRPALGVALPTYDRANGLTVGWGTALGLGGDTASVLLTGIGTYATETERFGGSLELLLRPTPGGYIALRGSRGSRTRDRWIRGDFSNSISALFLRSDVRNYYESDEVELVVGRLPPLPLIQGESYVGPRFGVRVSEDRSLPAGDPWSIFRSDEAWRSNPAIDEGRVESVFAGAAAGWRGVTARFSGDAEVEWSPGGRGDFEFVQLRAGSFWTMVPRPLHRVDARAHLLLTLSGNAPGQRWSTLGGIGTLPVLEAGTMRGDQLFFVETVYLLPVRGVILPVAGAPFVRVEYAAGAAWESAGERPDFTQNLGLGLQLRVFRAVFHVDPVERPRKARLSLGVEVPAGIGRRSF